MAYTPGLGEDRNFIESVTSCKPNPRDSQLYFDFMYPSGRWHLSLQDGSDVHGPDLELKKILAKAQRHIRNVKK